MPAVAHWPKLRLVTSSKPSSAQKKKHAAASKKSAVLLKCVPRKSVERRKPRLRQQQRQRLRLLPFSLRLSQRHLSKLRHLHRSRPVRARATALSQPALHRRQRLLRPLPCQCVAASLRMKKTMIAVRLVAAQAVARLQLLYLPRFPHVRRKMIAAAAS